MRGTSGSGTFNSKRLKQIILIHKVVLQIILFCQFDWMSCSLSFMFYFQENNATLGILMWRNITIMSMARALFSLLWRTGHLEHGCEGIQLRPETNNEINFLPIRLCFINVYTQGRLQDFFQLNKMVKSMLTDENNRKQSSVGWSGLEPSSK